MVFCPNRPFRVSCASVNEAQLALQLYGKLHRDHCPLSILRIGGIIERYCDMARHSLTNRLERIFDPLAALAGLVLSA